MTAIDTLVRQQKAARKAQETADQALSVATLRLIVAKAREVGATKVLLESDKHFGWRRAHFVGVDVPDELDAALRILAQDVSRNYELPFHKAFLTYDHQRRYTATQSNSMYAVDMAAVEAFDG